ncbi:MAG TPA: taurine dioxygenase, partial [Planctomycetes bacterium]|nr:taurine dioxygenase [Planctomycetota bacterium]
MDDISRELPPDETGATPVSERQKGPQELQRFELMYPPVTHPIVRTHPVTGNKSIFVNPQFTIRIIGMNEIESRS